MILKINSRSVIPLMLAIYLAIWLSGCSDFYKKPMAQKQKPALSSTVRLPQSKTAARAAEGEDQDSFSYDDENDIDYVPLAGNQEGSPECEALAEDNSTEGIRGQSILDEALDFYQASQDFWQQGEMDNALHALDQAYTLIIEAEAYDIPKLNQQKDDLRFMISKRILEIYASRHSTAKGDHNAIPMVINADIQKEIDLFTGESRDFFIASYIRSGKYRSFIVNEFKKQGLPEELSWLPLIESGFKVKALSKARALGLWQFIASTGYKFGLKRDHHVDERLDPYKSTLAAIQYLKELHDIFGDWMTVLAAYNCGENRVLSIIRDQNVNYLDDFWDLYQKLPCETRRYVPQFLATLHVVNNLNKYYMDDLVPDRPVGFDTVVIAKQVYLKNIADVINVSEDQLTELNPELRYKILPPEEYLLRVPAATKDLLLANLETIPQCTRSIRDTASSSGKGKSRRPDQDTELHRVRTGETLSSIAGKYNTTVEEILSLNNFSKKKRIYAGDVVKIPQSKKSVEK
ncbi:MAG TPA: transglycosylase SLT domain-containing protein, partial [Candidatus Gracilibacteria bacterium]|nr:transglycosylase SLT domain-containing protein [Candidatus Gracilibacteria bacterium]